MQGVCIKRVTFHSILLILFVVLSCMACGIDTIAYLTEIPKVLSREESALNFSGPSIQEDNYYGIFIFYRIYASETDAISDVSSIETRQNATNAVPGSNVESYLVSSSGLDYQQLVLDGNLSIPTLDEEDLSLDVFANITFASASNVEPTLTTKNAVLNTVIREYELRRSALVSSGLYLSFLDEPQKGNLDFKSSTSDENENEYHIQFFAAAYGLDLSDLSELYGDAVYLGRIKQYF